MSHEAPAVAELQVAETLEAVFDSWQQLLEHLEADSETLAGTGRYPEWYRTEDMILSSKIKTEIKSGVAGPNYVTRYFELYSKKQKMDSIITGRNSVNSPLRSTIDHLGEEVVGLGFADEPADGSLHTALLAELVVEGGVRSRVLTPELNVLKKAYGVDNLTKLLGLGGDDYSDRLQSALLQPNPIKSIRSIDQEGMLDSGASWSQKQERSLKWMSCAVEAATGMPAEEASDYVFSASRKNDSEHTNTIHIINTISHFGLDRLRKLAKFSGIHGLECYTIGQLEYMEELAINPAEVAEKLSQHDVIVVMINRTGDHNGVLRNVAADFDDNSKRTIFFEINRMADIGRLMKNLHIARIEPSTIVLASHSAPGQFMVSDDRDNSAKRRDIATVAGSKLVEMANTSGDHEPGDFGYSIQGFSGTITKVVDEWMKPSRGIDDDRCDTGRIKIIFTACHTGTEVKSGDIDDNGIKIITGMESVVSQLGKGLIASGVQSDVDIYGAPSGIQMHSDDVGVYYSGQPGSFSFSRTPVNAVRIRKEGNELSTQSVNGIALRKAAA